MKYFGSMKKACVPEWLGERGKGNKEQKKINFNKKIASACIVVLELLMVLYTSAENQTQTMVLTLDGSSERVAHVGKKTGLNK